MNLGEKAGHEASIGVQETVKETKFLPGLLQDSSDADIALKNAQAVLAEQEEKIRATEERTVNTNNRLSSRREDLSKTMDHITTIDNTVDNNKTSIANNSHRMAVIDEKIRELKEGGADESPQNFKAVSGSDNATDITEASAEKIRDLEREKEALIAKNAALEEKNDQLSKEKIPLIATRDDLQKNLIPTLEEEARQLTNLHDKQISEKGKLLVDTNIKIAKNAEIQGEIKNQESMIAQMNQSAIERIRQYEEHVAAESRPDPNAFEYGKSIWA